MATSQGWRDIQRHQLSTPRRLIRLAMFGVLAALVTWFVVELVAPFHHPNSHLVYLLAGDAPESGVATPPYALRQYAHLTPLKSTLSPSESSTSRIPLLPLAGLERGSVPEPSVLESITADDAVIIYINAQQSEIAIDETVSRVQQLPGRTKLIILDTATDLLASQGLLLPDAFTSQLEAAIRNTGDRSLWVLTSHSLLENSHLSPALRRSVFGYFVARALKGDADFNGNQVIETDELLIYVRSGVQDWVAHMSGGNATQTPQLLWGGGDQSSAPWPQVPLVSISTIAAQDREQNLQASVAQASRPREKNQWENVFQESAADQMRPLINPIRDKLNAARVPEKTAQLSELTSADRGGASDDPASTASPDEDHSANDSPTDESATESTPSDPLNSSVDPIDAMDDAVLLDQLGQAWLIHEQLSQPVAKLPRPLDYAPDLWWRYEQTLLAVDQSIRAGLRFDARSLKRLLKEQLLSMSTLLQPQPPRPSTDSKRLVDLFLARRPRFDSSAQISSLALLEAAGLSKQRWNETQRASILAFRDAVEQTDPVAFVAWLDGLSQPPLAESFDEIVELRLARQLGSLAKQDWNLARQAIQTAMIGEEAAVLVAANPTGQTDVLKADQLRREGERVVRDQLSKSWQQVSRSLFSKAEAIYRSEIRDAEVRARANRLANDLMARLPYLVALQRCGGSDLSHPFPTVEDIDQLLETLHQRTLRQRSGRFDRADLQNELSRLENLGKRLSGDFGSSQAETLTEEPIGASDAWYLSLLLRTPWIPANTRMKWMAVLGEIETVGLQNYSPSIIEVTDDAPLSLAHWQHDIGHPTRMAKLQRRATDWIRWQSLLFSIANASPPNTSPAAFSGPFVSLELANELLTWSESTVPVQQFPNDYQRFVTFVKTDQRQWQVRMSETLTEAVDLSDPNQRTNLRSRLNQLQLANRLLLPQASPLFSPKTLSRRLISTIRYDQFAWQIRRQQAAMANSLPGDIDYLVAASDAYQTLAAAEPMHPPIAAKAPSKIQIQASASIRFAPNQTSASTDITVINQSDQPQEVWLLVRSDPRFLSVDSRNQPNVYAEQAVHDELRWRVQDADDQLQSLSNQVSTKPEANQDASIERIKNQTEQLRRLRKAAVYPYQPSQIDLPSTFSLEPGATRTVTFKLERVNQITRQTKVVVRALTNSDHTRADITAVLPDRTPVELVIDGRQSTWSKEDEQVWLHPYPNRMTPYRVSLRNTRGTDLETRISVVTFSGALPSDLPQTLLPIAAAEDWIDSLPNNVTVVSPRSMVLPANGDTVEILPQPPELPAVTEPEQPDAVPAATTPPTADGPQTFSITSGLLVIIRDDASGTAAIKPIFISPQRPRRYVRTQLRYDAAVGKLTIEIIAAEGVTLPTDGVPIEVRLSDDSPRPLQQTLSGNLSQERRSVQLSAELANSNQNEVWVEIDVDQFPRAFLFRFHPTDSQPSIPEWVARRRVAILNPQPGQAFAAPLNSINVVAKVDAPVGSFLNPRDQFQLGIDQDRDREFRDESPSILRSDRQVRATWQPPKPGPPGEEMMEVMTQVTDFELAIPTGTINASRVNVLGYLRAGKTNTWSAPIEIILDGRAPTLGVVRVLPGRTITQETPLEISVSADNDGLSEIAGVKVGFANPGTLTFSEAIPPVDAALTSGGVWTATVPTKDLASGSQRLLLQATDQVGNVSQPKSLALQIRSKSEAEAENMRPKHVLGTVIYGKKPVVGAIVELFSSEAEPRLIAKRTASEEGHFEFKRVAPGTYRIKTGALIRNNRYFAEQELIVPEGPKAMPPISIEIN